MTPDARALHVAALPFPSHQGTQAALRAMLDALARSGRTSPLLAYAHAGYADTFAFPVHRSAELVRYRSLRSGPSAHKLLADAALARALSRARRTLRPPLVVAHHVEAALVAARADTCLFFAHTDLEAELPSYAHAAHAPWLSRAGGALDAWLVRRAGAVAAISPALTARMRARADAHASKIHCVLPPWPVPDEISDVERHAARAELGLGQQSVLLYAGNLDAYQGWEDLVHALVALPDALLLVGTQSDPAPLLRMAQSAGVAARLQIHAIDSEAARRRLHACADVAVVPRRAAGGLPIKLLDALARGVACAITPRASAGLPLQHAAHVAQADDALALARAIADLLAARERRAQLGEHARRYVATHHSDAAFVAAYDGVCRAALTRTRALTTR
jgi:glycosyltransferase involved in cell wall biosynthesis